MWFTRDVVVDIVVDLMASNPVELHYSLIIVVLDRIKV